MDDALQQSEPKISVVVGILGLFVAVVFDILSFIPFVGDIEEIPSGMVLVLNFVIGAPMSLIVAQGIAMVLKAIPVVQEFPVWTPAWLAAWYIETHRSSKLAQWAERGAAVAGTLEGEAGGLEEAAEGAGAAAEEAGAAAGTLGEAGAATGGAAELGAEGEMGAASAAARGQTEETGQMQGEQTAEAKKKAENLEKELESPAQRPPEEEAEKKDFELGDDVTAGGNNEKNKGEAPESPAEDDKEVKALRERLEKMQKRWQVRDVSAPESAAAQGGDEEDGEDAPEELRPAA